MNKPYQTLIFLVLVLILYLGIAFLSPSYKLSFLNVKIRVPIPQVKQATTGEVHTLAQTKTTDTLTNKNQVITDSVDSAASSVPPKELTLTEKYRSYSAVPIETSESGLSAMSEFFGQLNGDAEKLTVLHYGDSQVEGDRITGTIRSTLQKRFGGKGKGFIPLYYDLSYYQGISYQTSTNWSCESVLKAEPQERAEGILGMVAKIQPSAVFRNILDFNFKQRVSSLTVLYGKTDSAFNIKVVAKGNELMARQFPPTTRVDSFTINLPDPCQSLSILMQNASPVRVYGVFADDDHGVCVSNIALRGSSGNFFSSFDFQTASEVYRLLNVRLVILQFGINVVPSNLNSYKYYEELMARQIRSIKSFAPKASILVVGVTDMATRTDGLLKTFPSVELVLNAQRNAALKNGAAFWDAYMAMGGEGSIIDWVNANPSLATKDYTHFTYLGAIKFGNLLANALMDSYYRWTKTNYSETIPVNQRLND